MVTAVAAPPAAKRDQVVVRRNRRGAVVRHVLEHYLRTDLPCGSTACRRCPAEAAVLDAVPGTVYLVPDVQVHDHDKGRAHWSPYHG